MKWKSIKKPPNLSEITEINISYKNLNNIPDWTSKCYNLIKLHCYGNQITQIPNNLPNSLQHFDCSNNKITQIPDKLPDSLQYFECYYNQITQIPDTLPNLLREFFCHHNKITQIPISLMQLKNLNQFYYENNPIEYISPIMSRFLNNLRNKMIITVYNDHQSVHNHNIQECVRKSIYSILQDKYNDNHQLTINQILNDTILEETSKNALVEYSNTTDTHSILNITFKDLLIPVWQRIQKHSDSIEIKKILNTEIKDGLCMCFTGRMSRLVNCLNGFYSDIVINIGTNEQIGNIVVMIGNKLKSNGNYTEKLHRQLVRKQMEEMNYEEKVINEWLEFI